MAQLGYTLYTLCHSSKVYLVVLLGDPGCQDLISTGLLQGPFLGLASLFLKVHTLQGLLAFSLPHSI